MLNTVCNEALENALARSALYGVIASAFRQPDNPLFRTFATQEELEALQEAIECVGAQNQEALQRAALHLHHTSKNLDQNALMSAFIFLFGHISRGRVPPYETEYGTGGPFFQPQEMSDITGFYNAFGLELDTSKHERMDHICCECEFMCFLCAKQAYALEIEDVESADECVRVQRMFLRDHLASFGHTFFIRIRQESGTSWHAAAAALGTAFLDAECERFDLIADRTYLPLRSNEEVNVPMACGSCSVPCGGAESPED